MAGTTKSRVRSNTVAGKLDAVRQATTFQGIPWPEVVSRPKGKARKHAETLFAQILTSRPPDAWKEIDMVMASHLALAFVELDALTSVIATEGRFTEGARGQPVNHPAVAASATVSARISSMMLRLGLARLGTDAGVVRRAAKEFSAAGGQMYQPQTGSRSTIDHVRDADGKIDWVKTLERHEAQKERQQ